MKRGYCFVLFSLCSVVLFYTSNAQSQTDSLLIQWAEFLEDESNLAEIIEELAENPVDINSPDRNDLLRIPLINSSFVDSILNAKAEIGMFTSKRQIRSIIGAELYDLIKEFITIRPKPNHSLIYTHKSYYGIEPIKQIENGTYRGDAFYDYNKIQFYWKKNFRVGLVSQKDIGEGNYLDYINGFVEYNSGYIKGIIGSYYCHFGEGLLFSNAYGQQKSSMASLPFREGKDGCFASLSSSENTGLFGAGVNMSNFYGSNLCLFYSSVKRDAQFTQDWNYIIGIDYDGYHRSNAEIKKKDVIKESVWGIAWKRSFFSCLTFGLNYALVSYNPPYEFYLNTVGEGSLRRQRFKFSGSQIDQFSAHYALKLNAVHLNGEAAGSQQGGPAFTQSLSIDEGIVTFGIKYWFVSKNFHSPFGRVFDNSNPFPQAEEGFYLGMTANPFNRFSISTFKIAKKDLWRTYFDTMPKMKDESFIEINYQSENLAFLSRLRIKDDEYFIDPQNETSIVRNIEQQNIYRLQLDYKPAKMFLFRTRWESTEIRSTNENGSYLFEDVHIYPNSDFAISTRILFYQTDSYNSRLYEYESDLPGSYANYAVYGEGRVFYLLFTWKIYTRVSLMLKFRYNNIIKNDLTASIIRKDDNTLQRILRMQIRISF